MCLAGYRQKVSSCTHAYYPNLPHMHGHALIVHRLGDLEEVLVLILYISMASSMASCLHSALCQFFQRACEEMHEISKYQQKLLSTAKVISVKCSDSCFPLLCHFVNDCSR